MNLTIEQDKVYSIKNISKQTLVLMDGTIINPKETINRGGDYIQTCLREIGVAVESGFLALHKNRGENSVSNSNRTSVYTVISHIGEPDIRLFYSEKLVTSHVSDLLSELEQQNLNVEDAIRSLAVNEGLQQSIKKNTIIILKDGSPAKIKTTRHVIYDVDFVK